MPAHPRRSGPEPGDRRTLRAPHEGHRRSTTLSVGLWTIVAIGLLSTPTGASAKTPIAGSHPPFAASTIYRNTTTYGGCGGYHLSAHPASLGRSNGRVELSINTSAHPAAGCPNYYADSYAQGLVQVLSPNLTLYASGTHVLRSYWWLDFVEKLSATTAAPGTPSYGEADASLIVQVTLHDRTPFGFGGVSSSANFGNQTQVSNSSMTLRYNSSISFPLSVTLTRGHTYQIDIALFASVHSYALISSTGNSGSARVDIGMSGHAAIFEGWTIY